MFLLQCSTSRVISHSFYYDSVLNSRFDCDDAQEMEK